MCWAYTWLCTHCRDRSRQTISHVHSEQIHAVYIDMHARTSQYNVRLRGPNGTDSQNNECAISSRKD